MDDKTKLYIFDRKEVFLIFLFMVLIAITSFAMGVRIGKSYTYKIDGFIEQDRQNVELKSRTEEQMEKELAVVEGEDAPEEKSKITMDTTHKALEEELSKLAEGEGVATTKTTKKVEQLAKKVAVDDRPAATAALAAVENSYVGKYTIQLGSHPNLVDAQRFADGLKIRGYNPIINEVKLQDKGIWFRVSLGVFNTVVDAKDYIQKEESLFRGKDYVIGKLE